MRRDGASTIASCNEAEFDKIVEVDLRGVGAHQSVLPYQR